MRITKKKHKTRVGEGFPADDAEKKTKTRTGYNIVMLRHEVTEKHKAMIGQKGVR